MQRQKTEVDILEVMGFKCFCAVDRCFLVGESVLDVAHGHLGMVLEVHQSCDIQIPIEAFKPALKSSVPTNAQQQNSQHHQQQTQQSDQQEQHDGTLSRAPSPTDGSSRLPARLCNVHIRALGPPVLSLEPPVIQYLWQFETGTAVLQGGRLGCVVDSKSDYVIALESGHEFTFEDG